MRIIGGSHKGKVIKVPKDLPVRPTTDFAKEGLFNILTNKVDFEDLKVLDLFSGTGHISLEFASRGAQEISAVEGHQQRNELPDHGAKSGCV
jgi:16S rRNA (guanine966-N2)-methyltransferase